MFRSIWRQLLLSQSVLMNLTLLLKHGGFKRILKLEEERRTSSCNPSIRRISI